MDCISAHSEKEKSAKFDCLYYLVIKMKILNGFYLNFTWIYTSNEQFFTFCFHGK